MSKQIKTTGPVFARVTKAGLDRLPSNFIEGDILPVDSISAAVSADCWVAHVRDGNGSIWSLGEGQWEQAGANFNNRAICDLCALTVIDTRIRTNGWCAICDAKQHADGCAEKSPRSSNPYFITHDNKKVYFSEIAKLVRIDHPELVGKHIFAQLNATGLRKAFDRGTTPFELPYSFSDCETQSATR